MEKKQDINSAKIIVMQMFNKDLKAIAAKKNDCVLILIRKQEARQPCEGEKLMKVFESAGLFLHDKSSFLLNEGGKKWATGLYSAALRCVSPD